MHMKNTRSSLTVCLGLGLALVAAAAEGTSVQVGAARMDITPELPIRLSGYQGRTTEAAKVEKPLFARALAVGGETEGPAVLVTLEVIGVSQALTDAVAAAVKQSHGVARERVAVLATHTHNGPAVAGVLPFMYGRDLPADEVARIERFTAMLQEKAIAVARAALQDRKPGRLAWAQGKTDFAVQRRKIVNGKWAGFGVDPGGMVDHALPLLRATDAAGGIRALLVNYACHCTTLGVPENFVHSDWAGDAAERIERAHAGAVAMVAIGCGADANPITRTLAAVAEHGAKVAAEVERLLAAPMQPLGAVSAAQLKHIELPLDPLPTRDELELRRGPKARQQNAYAASKWIAEIDAGRALPKVVPYPVQTWSFGRGLTMVFLGGEVVSQYALRLRRELDGARVWVNAYANAVPCYIPSQAMYPEGGYEVDSSMDYYGFATRLAAGTEDRIVGTVLGMVPREFRASDGGKP